MSDEELELKIAKLEKELADLRLKHLNNKKSNTEIVVDILCEKLISFQKIENKNEN